MAPDGRAESARPLFTVVAEQIGDDAWHVTVRELPDTWTVAFSRGEIETRARHRIALDLAVEPSEFDVTVARPDLRVERRANHRPN